MDLENRTAFPSAFFNTIISEERLLGAVVVKAVFKIESSRLIPDSGPPWPVGGIPIKTEFGELDGETPFLREGVDLILLGNAYSSTDSPNQIDVTVGVGEFSYRMKVFGDRIWIRRSPEEPLIPCDPAPFPFIPLTWEHAYGGTADVDAGKMPFAANPIGRGFYLDERQAEGKPLPNIENPDHLIQNWQDQPDPAGAGPYSREWSLRALRAVEINHEGPVPRIVKFKPAYFNNANPPLILNKIPTVGESVSISNVQPDGKLFTFKIPDLDFHVYVQLQDRPYVFPAHLESMVFLTEESRIVLGYRCVFRYRMVPLERRMAVLREGPVPSSPPPDYFIHWDTLAPEVQTHE